jgi:ABC-type sugar transport system ATPase subunit
MGSSPLLEVRGLSKRFGPVIALNDVSFSVEQDEIVALVGDNGAGKSTFVNILSGAVVPTAGSIYIDGNLVEFHNSHEARSMGIETVYQDLALAGNLAAWANLFLGREVTRRGLLGKLGWLDKRSMMRDAQTAMDSVKIRMPSVRSECGSLSGGQRQAVAVARAVTWGSRVLLMDEPTAALGVEQQKQVGELIRSIKGTGTPVILVSHNLPQVEAVADRIMVFFQGRLIKELVTSETSTEEIVTWITGAGLRRAPEKGE